MYVCISLQVLSLFSPQASTTSGTHNGYLVVRFSVSPMTTVGSRYVSLNLTLHNLDTSVLVVKIHLYVRMYIICVRYLESDGVWIFAYVSKVAVKAAMKRINFWK